MRIQSFYDIVIDMTPHFGYVRWLKEHCAIEAKSAFISSIYMCIYIFCVKKDTIDNG